MSCAIVVMPKPTKKRTPEQYAAMMAHEATHVVQRMRENLGELGLEGEAYLVQQIVQEGLNIARKTGKSRRVRP